MTDEKKAAPQELADTALDEATGGINMGKSYADLNPKISTVFFDDNKPVRKVLLAQASGGGNVTGNGGAPAPSEYTFGEDVGDDIIPVTYKLID